MFFAELANVERNERGDIVIMDLPMEVQEIVQHFQKVSPAVRQFLNYVTPPPPPPQVFTGFRHLHQPPPYAPPTNPQPQTQPQPQSQPTQTRPPPQSQPPQTQLQPPQFQSIVQSWTNTPSSSAQPPATNWPVNLAVPGQFPNQIAGVKRKRGRPPKTAPAVSQWPGDPGLTLGAIPGPVNPPQNATAAKSSRNLTIEVRQKRGRSPKQIVVVPQAPATIWTNAGMGTVSGVVPAPQTVATPGFFVPHGSGIYNVENTMPLQSSVAPPVFQSTSTSQPQREPYIPLQQALGVPGSSNTNDNSQFSKPPYPSDIPHVNNTPEINVETQQDWELSTPNEVFEDELDQPWTKRPRLEDTALESAEELAIFLSLIPTQLDAESQSATQFSSQPTPASAFPAQTSPSASLPTPSPLLITPTLAQDPLPETASPPSPAPSSVLTHISIPSPGPSSPTPVPLRTPTPSPPSPILYLNYIPLPPWPIIPNLEPEPDLLSDLALERSVSPLPIFDVEFRPQPPMTNDEYVDCLLELRPPRTFMRSFIDTDEIVQRSLIP